MATPFHLGIDFGTSGARACVIAPDASIEAFEHIEFGAWQDYAIAGIWRETLWELLARLPLGARRRLATIAVDGTSATLLACDAALTPLAPPLAYHDTRARDEAARIARVAGADNPASAPSSGLAKALWLEAHLGAGRADCYLNQADWLTGLLCDRVGVADYHNVLKMGFDVGAGRWPDWLDHLIDMSRLPLPRAGPPGEAIGTLARPRARDLGIPVDCLVRLGTTDSIAAFLATGATEPGEAVTSLGSTLVLKLLSTTRVEAAEYGVYSHWFGDLWLAGGASNAGGAALRQHFDPTSLTRLSAAIDPETSSGLDYYPLPRPGERFPYNDPEFQPRLTPRPNDDRQFLHGLLEGLARIEALGYQRLRALGATPARRVITCGGGAANPTWTRLRERLLGVPVRAAECQEAAYGAARLACHGTALFGGAHVAPPTARHQ
jgi:sugar (pentulose or hexulose) kinase